MKAASFLFWECLSRDILLLHCLAQCHANDLAVRIALGAHEQRAAVDSGGARMRVAHPAEVIYFRSGISLDGF